MGKAMDFTSQNGMVAESAYKYTAKNGDCQYDQGVTKEVVFTNDGYEDISSNDNAALQDAVAMQPISVAIEADKMSFQMYSTGIFDSSSCGTSLDHGVAIVGRGTENGTAYWILRNSWGTSWGEAGYMKIKDTTGKGICGINMQPVRATYQD